MSKHRFKVGILGAGYIADWHLRALRQLRVEVVGIADAQADRASSLAQRYRVPHAVTDVDALLAEAKPDAVHILLPPECHFEFAKRILEAGTHVLLEKPACINERECVELNAIATATGRQVGVSHNFLFSPVYERLRDAVRAGLLGPLCEVDITWAKELGQLRGGPFGGWLFREPANVIMEVGPHSAAHALDLVGDLPNPRIEADQPISLPGGVMTFRRWHLTATAGQTRVNLRFALGPGFTTHRIEVRGLVASASADFEAGTFTIQQHSPLPDDFARQRMTARAAKAQLWQSRGKLARYVFGKFKLSKRGSDYGTSIARALVAFYQQLDGSPDARLSLDLATRTVALCETARQVPIPLSEPVPTAPIFFINNMKPTVLITGGTGFIGQAVVRKLSVAGYRVRVLVRSPLHLPPSIAQLPLEVLKGDLSRAADLDAACAGAGVVLHLARAHVNTWADYERLEIAPTRQLAEAALRHGVGRFLYTGTIDSYYAGSAAALIDDDTPVDAKIDRRNLYAKAKAMSEAALRELARDKALPLAIFRPGIVIGAGGSPFHWGVGMWFHDAVVRLWGRAQHPLPFVLVDDVAAALVAAIERDGVIGQTFNLVGPPLLTGCDYVNELSRITGIRIDARPTAITRFYLSDLAKWCIKVLVRHPNRRFPSFRDWKSRTQATPMHSRRAIELLGWSPVNDRERLIHDGIEVPARAWLA